MPASGLPLEGVRVLDLGIAWAGATCGRVLADLGADVIRVESRRRTDTRGPANPPKGTGFYPRGEPASDPWNRSGVFNERHRNKRSVTLELDTPAGRQLFEQLVAHSDVVVHNMSTSAARKLGLTYDNLSRLNADIIYVTLTGHGWWGPEESYVSYGDTLEQVSGAAALTGYTDGPPMNSGVHWGDPAAGYAGAAAIIAAVLRREATGRGAFVDMPQRELIMHMIGDQFLQWSRSGTPAPRLGNRDPRVAPQGVYRCRGDDRWIAISIETDDQWTALCRGIGREDWAVDPAFASVAGRSAHHDEIDAMITDWAVSRERDQAWRVLVDIGVPAGPVQHGEDLTRDPHLSARGFLVEVEHSSAGPQLIMGVPWQFRRGPFPGVHRPAPLMGQHNSDVLSGILKLPREEIAELQASDVIGTAPFPEN